MTAYDQMMDRLSAGLKFTAERLDKLDKLTSELFEYARNAQRRIDGALRRIEQLELTAAKQQAWSRPPAEMCISCGTPFVTPEHAKTHRCSS